MEADPLPVLAAGSVELDAADRPGWLVEGLWAAAGVGIVGGAPKCCKTWLSLDLAVSVASGTDALGRFHVETPGPVLLYAAEDAPVRIRDRLEAIASARGLPLADLDVGLIVTDSVRLDTERDRARLRATLERRPRLLILDPLVRLHRIDENSAGEMSALLGELRAVQRAYDVAVLLVHHLRKNAAPRGQDGQSLRGSGDLHAWGDSNLYLRRRDRQLLLTIEHRSAPSPPSCTLELAEEPSTHLRVVDGGPVEHDVAVDTAERIAALLSGGASMTREQLRDALRARNATVGEALVRLRAADRIERCEGGFRLRGTVPVPAPMEGNGNGTLGTHVRPAGRPESGASS
jgi:DNA-binding transcriptional ArsR family regulator